MAKTIDMTQGKPSKLLLQFAFPVLVGNLFQQLYTLVDRVIVGQFVGANAFSAVGSTNALSMMFMSMCMGTAIGAGVVVSQYFGAKDQKNTAKAIANGAYVNVIVALIFLAFCSILNIILDIIFVVPLGMGVEGAAIATVMAQAIAAVLCMIYAFKKVPQFHDAVHYLKPDSVMIRHTLKIGIPTGFQYSLMHISSIALQRVVNGFGESVIGAFTSTTQIELLVQQIYAALGTAMVTYTGQNIGAGKTDRVKQGMHSAMQISGIVSVILLAVFWLGGSLIMSIFVPDQDIISLASSGIRITSLFFMALGVVQVLRYLLNGAGDSVYALVNGIVEIIARIGFAFLLTAIPFIGMWGIWLTTGLTWLVTAVFAFWRYKGGAWMSKSLVGGLE